MTTIIASAIDIATLETTILIVIRSSSYGFV